MADVNQRLGLAQQIRLVAGLRWRIIRHSFSNKSRRLDLLGLVLSGILGSVFVVGVSIAFFMGTEYLLEQHEERLLSLLFLALLVWWQLFPILLAGFAPQFSFRSLLRFPVDLSAFYLIGLAYGLGDSAAIAALVWMAAMIAATVMAQPVAAPVMLLACLLFAGLNITMERLLGAWVEKILAKRRTREVFFALFILAVISAQFLNPIVHKYGSTLVLLVRSWLPYFWLLPSSFAGDAVAQITQHHWAAALLKLFGLAMYLLLFSFLLWKRYGQLYAGEEFSETTAPARAEKRAALTSEDQRDSFAFLPQQALAVFRKELLYLKRNTFLFFGLIFPPMLLLFFSVQLTGEHSTPFKHGLSADRFFPGMMAYLVLILIAPAYNCFAYEGKGIQSYYMSPVRFREILLAKNLITASILFCEIALCIGLVGWRVGLPTVPVLIATFAALIFSIVGQLTIANWSSLSFPRKIEFGKMQGQRNSGMSVLVVFLVQIVFAGVSALILLSARWTGNPWLPAEVFAVLGAVALGGYFSALDAFTQLAEAKKEVLIDALCR